MPSQLSAPVIEEEMTELWLSLRLASPLLSFQTAQQPQVLGAERHSFSHDIRPDIIL